VLPGLLCQSFVYSSSYWFCKLSCICGLAERHCSWIKNGCQIANVSLPDRCDIKYAICAEVHEILSDMANNKAGDCYGLCTENYKLVGDLYYSFLAVCINVMLTHSYISAGATQTVTCPTVNDKNDDLSDVS